jgi:hypothetical protein
MSIRLIAHEFYRLHRMVERLERELEAAPLPRRDAIEDKLRKARAEYEQIKRVLEGQKDAGPGS